MKNILYNIFFNTEKPLGIQNFHLYFEPVFQRWIVVSKAKALQVS